MSFRVGIILFSSITSFSLFAQSGMELSANYVLGYQFGELDIWDDQVENLTGHGYRVQVSYTFRKDQGKVEGLLRAGLKQLHSSGVYGNSDFSTRSTKVLMAIGGRYWISEKFSLELMAGMENNRDFEDWRISTTDNLRYSTELHINIEIVNRLMLSTGMNYALYPIQSQYLIFNPQQQFNLGLTYRLF